MTQLLDPQPKRSRRIEVDYDADDEEYSFREQWNDFVTSLRSTVLQSEVYLRLSLLDARKRKASFCLGFFSVVLVVFLCGIMLTTLSYLQIIFLKLAESANGKMDLIVTPGGQFELANSLNYSVFETTFAAGALSYHAARIEFPSLMAYRWGNALEGITGCGDTAADAAALWYPSSPLVEDCTVNASNCPVAHCSLGAPSRPMSLFFLDPDREARMGLGNSWPYHPGPGEVILKSSLAMELGVGTGDKVVVIGDVSYPLMQAFVAAGLNDLGISDTASRLPYTSYRTIAWVATVAGIAEEDGEKFQSDVDTFMVADFESAVAQMAASLSPLVSNQARTVFADVPANTCASAVYINLPPSERTDVYSQTDYARIQSDVMAFSGQIFGVLGLNQVAIDTPILSYLFGVRFFSLFLGLIVSLIILGLSFLSVVLIYSLLTVNVETRTFELGLQRMIGFTKLNLTGLVLTNALLFAIPAWGVGLALALGGYNLVRAALASLLGVDLSSNLSPDAIGFATLAGLGIPLISSIAPVIYVLTLSLPDALDTQRSRVSAVFYKISRQAEGYLSFTMILLGVAFTLYGFLIYYLFPQSLVDFNISLMFYIFFSLLVGMLGGLVLLSLNFERVIESAVGWIFLFWESSAVFSIVHKNLIAHRPRNRKTTLMYSLSLGFIIFITVAFNIQLTSIEYQSKSSMGNTVRYRGSLEWNQFLAFDALLRTPDMQRYVSELTWISDDIAQQKSITNTTISSMGQFVTNRAGTSVVPPNFYDLVDSSFLLVGGAQSSPYSLSEYLYTADGSGKLIMSTSDKEALALDTHNSPFLYIATSSEIDPATSDNRKDLYVVAQCAHLDASPVVRMSKLPQAVGLNTLIGFPSVVQKSGGAFRSIRDVKIDSFIFGIAKSNLAGVRLPLAQLQASLGTSMSLRDLYSTTSDLDTAAQIVNIFFLFTQVMAMLICFFALLSAMTTNVMDQSKEIGILRCIGMTKFPLYRIYTFEAFVLVVSASLLGMAVGIVVAYSMMLQNSLFTQLPLEFEFPWQQLVLVLVVSLITSIVASYSPMAYMLSLPSITHILNRG